MVPDSTFICSDTNEHFSLQAFLADTLVVSLRRLDPS
jgi:hypothetical protein